ncbi:alanine--tRNA ligase [Fuerstiella marisgermanici]|uniref:Alanine--tRNA ligase n=1 Tax=Fuerstiella marisgermanici TaxID=1891926 RepID=A0A1P8WD82_9PLAN|nr:alanine--tRNA ligase [Fuerstiella marisgermanici]APZ92010.1 Alanine--tRNA ligase [Fuerstiella marisgermanici]
MKTDELREKYLSFFETKGCLRRPSDVLVPRDDPTVLFTPAGMNQFKNEFMGIGKLEFTAATTCQKCLRTGDISNVGVTPYHHTFFEMLGNFSFGDYFKREAIHWAWEFLTDAKWLGLDKDRLTVSVYKGKWGFDEEAFNIWKDEIGLPADRIACLEEDENYWPASAPSEGPDGVCGPCSEIFYHPPGVDGDVEIWNLVFTQFNRVGDPPDNLRPLPSKNIDTGMGLERTAAVLQGVSNISNFENDVLKPLCVAAGDVVGVKYEFAAPQGRAIRRIADHVRAATFAMHEGVMPDREKENYVIRQLVRRALLEGYLLGRKDPFLYEIVPAVVDVMQGAYPEIGKTVESVQNSLKEEESQFLGTIERGLSRFDRFAEAAKSAGSKSISGDDAFTLHTEDGFLIELTEAIAADRGLTVDMPAFKERMGVHEEISRGGKTVSVMAAGPLDLLRKEHGDTEFVGYEEATCDSRIIGLIVDKKSVDSVPAGFKGAIGIVLDKTPFYGESGGQVGDSGWLKSDGVEVEITDSQKHQQTLFVLEGRLRKGQLAVGDTVTAEVDTERRSAIRRAHSATHILHHALHRTVGENATQRGSKVEADALRFDFAHKQALSPDEIRQVEDIINSQIVGGSEVNTELLPMKEARERGAMALFGEKYPDKVRVVTMGDFSVELCGGTHLTNTGQVGLCRITSEEPVAKGVRRITAVTGPKALQKGRETDELVIQLQRMLKATKESELPARVEALQTQLKDLNRQLAELSKASVADAVGEVVAAAEEVGGVKIVAQKLEGVPREALRDFVDQLRDNHSPIAVLLAAEIDGKVALIAAVSKSLVKEKGMNAGAAVKAAAQVAGGGGGGRPDMAEAGAKLVDKIDEAIVAGADVFRQQLG